MSDRAQPPAGEKHRERSEQGLGVQGPGEIKWTRAGVPKWCSPRGVSGKTVAFPEKGSNKLTLARFYLSPSGPTNGLYLAHG